MPGGGAAGSLRGSGELARPAEGWGWAGRSRLTDSSHPDTSEGPGCSRITWCQKGRGESGRLTARSAAPQKDRARLAALRAFAAAAEPTASAPCPVPRAAAVRTPRAAGLRSRGPGRRGCVGTGEEGSLAAWAGLLDGGGGGQGCHSSSLGAGPPRAASWSQATTARGTAGEGSDPQAASRIRGDPTQSCAGLRSPELLVDEEMGR